MHVKVNVNLARAVYARRQNIKTPQFVGLHRDSRVNVQVFDADRLALYIEHGR
jgi:hypothetical protein